MFTLYTQGETSSFKAALEGVALIFQDPFFSSNAAMGVGYGVLLGILILLTFFIYSTVFKKTFDLKNVLIPLIAYVMLAIPKTDVHIADVYNRDAPQVVSGVPIGLAFLASIASGSSYVFTREYEQAFSTPNSPRILTDGFVTPLKTLNALREINLNVQNPDLARLVRDTYKSCLSGNSGFSVETYLNAPDSYVYFSNFLRTKAQGVVAFTAIDGSQSVISCSDAADKISIALHAFMYGDGSGGIETLIYNFKELMNLELKSKGNGGGVHQLNSTDDFLSDFAALTERTTDDGRLFMTNALFNPLLVSASFCASRGAENNEDRSSQCNAWVQANESVLEDNAAGATGFISMMQSGQNALLIFGIMIFPIMVLIIVYFSQFAIQAISGYLIFLVSTYAWLPFATIVNFYTVSNFRNKVYTFTQKDDSDLFGIVDYPAFYESVSNSLMLANGLMAAIPVLCVFLFIGMGSAAMALQTRWNQGRSRYADTSLDAPPIIGSSALISQKSSFKSQGLGGMMPTDGGKSWESNHTQKDAAVIMQTMALSEQKGILEAKKAAISEQISRIDTSSKSGGETNEVKKNMNSNYELKFEKGEGFLILHNKSDIGSYGDNGAIDAKIIVNQDNKIVSITGLDAGELKLRLGIGKGELNNKIGTGLLSTDGSLNNGNGGQVIPMANSTVTKGYDGGINLRIFRIDFGASYKNADSVNSTKTEIEQEQRQQDRINLQTKGEEKESVSKYVFKLIQDDSVTTMKDGKAHSITKMTSVGEGYENANTLERKLELERMLKETQKQIDSKSEQIEKSLSLSISSNLLSEDVLHRIAAQKTVLADLEHMNREYAAKYGESWEAAREKARMGLLNTNVGIYEEAHARNYEALISYATAMGFSAETANKAHKHMTGIDLMKLNNIAPPTEYDWKNWKDIGAESEKALKAVEEKFGIKLDPSQANNIVVLNPADRTGYYGQKPVLLERPEKPQNLATGQYVSSNLKGNDSQPIISGSLRLQGSQQEMNGIRLYNAFLNAGFTPRQAKILTVEVGRENSWKVSGMYGLHNDPNKGHLINGGIISFNQDRKINLDKYMQKAGLMVSGNANKGTGSYLHGQESLNAMARFMKHELEHGGRTGWTKGWLALNNNKLSDSEVHSVVGRHYIVWAYDHNSFKDSGMKNLRDFNRIFENILRKQGKLTGEGVKLGKVAQMYSVAQLKSGAVLSKPTKPASVIPQHYRHGETPQLSKEDVQKVYEQNKEKLLNKTAQEIESKYGIKVVKNKKEGSRFEAEVTDYGKFFEKLVGNVETGTAERAAKLVAAAPKFYANKVGEASGAANAAIGTELDTITNKNPTVLNHPSINPYMQKPSREELGLPQDIKAPKKNLDVFNISNQVPQSQIDSLIKSEYEKNEAFKIQNDNMVDSLIASKASEKRKEQVKPINQYLQNNTSPQAKQAIMEAVQKANRRSNDNGKFTGLEE